MSREPSRQSYARAAQMIREGKWRVDPETGTVWSRKMKRPIGRKQNNGYHSLMLKHPRRAGALQVALHRVVWESVNGPIPPGLQINHIDGNKSNNAISNLELATPGDNIRHAIRTGLREPCAMAGKGEENPRAKLTADDVRAIRAQLAEGRLFQWQIGQQWGVTQSTVWGIKVGKRWGHVQ